MTQKCFISFFCELKRADILYDSFPKRHIYVMFLGPGVWFCNRQNQKNIMEQKLHESLFKYNY